MFSLGEIIGVILAVIFDEFVICKNLDDETIKEKNKKHTKIQMLFMQSKNYINFIETLNLCF